MTQFLLRHKLKIASPFRYYLLCAPATDNMIDGKHRWSFWWKKVSCNHCRILGKKN